MAGKKNEGFKALKDTTGGNRRDDRQIVGKNVFESISIDVKNALTVIYMLKSPEDNVVLRAIASLEGFAKKLPENLQLLCSLGILPYLLPLVHHADYLIKRFAQKLIGMLCSLEDFREQMYGVENILKKFVDILGKETDAVMHEYAALTLAELSSEYHATSELLKVENCIETLFVRIISPDPDVIKNSLDVMNHLLNDISGIEAFVESTAFNIKILLDLTPSSYPVIQNLAIEVLKQLTSWCRDTRVLLAFRDASGIEATLSILENDEWTDLHSSCLDVLLNVVDSPELCDYLLTSGCLLRLIHLLDTIEGKSRVGKILGVLARMSQTQKGRLALHSTEMEHRFFAYLMKENEDIQEPACLAMANLAHYNPCLNSIMEENPTLELLEIVTNPEKTLILRNMAAYALNVLCNVDSRPGETLVKNKAFEKLLPILLENATLPVEICKNIIQIFSGISTIPNLRASAINENLISAIISCIYSFDDSMPVDASLQVDALECLSGYLIECEARAIFNDADGAATLIHCLKSKYASVREWAGHLVAEASQNKYFVMNFIRHQGLERLIEEKNTRHSMPSWQSAIQAIFSNNLPAKFAYTGRLEFEDITQEGFYVCSHPNCKFFLLDDLLESHVSPIFPVYVANFHYSPTTSSPESTESSSVGSNEQKGQQLLTARPKESANLQKFMRGADRNSTEDFSVSESLISYASLEYADSVSETNPVNIIPGYIPDPYLSEYLENLNKRIRKEEFFLGDANWFCIHPTLVKERARIIAEFIAEEMSGPEPGPTCGCHYKRMHINELRFHLGTNIFPLGFIRVGDYLERAMLFKVLADRIGFPCAFVRGSYGRAWIEIAVPVINIEDVGNTIDSEIQTAMSSNSVAGASSKDTFRAMETFKSSCDASFYDNLLPEEGLWFPRLKMECFKAYPNYFLKPNVIVDLVVTPGRLININSHEAEEYCGNFLFNKT